MLEQRNVEIFKDMLDAVLQDPLKKTEVVILDGGFYSGKGR